MTKPYQPPFTLTHGLIKQVAEIAELLGQWKAANQDALLPKLRRSNRIKTIQASLAVEQNTLSIEQVTAVIEGKTVLGQPREIQEVRNAFAAYEAMTDWQPNKLEDLLTAHDILMHGLANDAGLLRTGGTGIYQGKELVHMAPPAGQLPRLMDNLFNWLTNTEAHPLIASAAFHYEFEFIHPFSDGNGRMGRLWQTLILSQWQPVLAYLPVETVIKQQQSEYYRLLGEADKNTDCTDFIHFLLEAIQNSLQEALLVQIAAQSETRVEVQVETRVQIPIKTPDEIIELLQQQPELSLAEIAKHIGRATSTVERAVAKLKQQGKLEYIGAKKGGHWKVIL